jgi:hypothetical protein
VPFVYHDSRGAVGCRRHFRRGCGSRRGDPLAYREALVRSGTRRAGGSEALFVRRVWLDGRREVGRASRRPLFIV